jgi:cobalt-precorrin 5A hydrolase
MADRQIVIAAGVGCRAGCSAEDIVAAVRAAAARSGVVIGDIRSLYSAEFKAAEAGLTRAARALDKPLRLLSVSALAAQASGALTASSAVAARCSLPSLAETAALAGVLELANELEHRAADLARGFEAAADGEPRGQHAVPRLLAARSVAGGAACALAWVEVGA